MMEDELLEQSLMANSAVSLLKTEFNVYVKAAAGKIHLFFGLNIKINFLFWLE
jgi:hypothetical protein